jgi:tripartite-type tricarboxylate transporter receptor subunit TctC
MRSLTCRLFATAALAMFATVASAQSDKTIRILVGFPVGGGTDAIARTLAVKLRGTLAANVIVENRPGAGGQLAAQVMKSPGYDPAKDFVAVAGFATFVNALAVSGGTPATSVDEYVAWVKTQGGGKGVVGIPAPASVPEFLVKVFAQRYQLDLVAAPYRGSAPMIGDMLGNQIAAGVGSVPDFIDQHKAGKLRVVGVLGSARQSALPDVPTFSELGLKGFEDVPYYGVFAPAGTPKATLDQLSAAIAQVIVLPEVRDRLTALGLTVAHTSGEQLAARERAYHQTWAKIIKDSGFQPQ